MDHRRIAAIAAALTMMTAAVSCGNDDYETSVTDSSVSVTGDTETEDTSKKSSDSGNSKDKTEKTTAKASDEKTNETTTAKASSDGNTASGGSNSSDGSSGGNTTSGGGASSAGGSTGGGASSGGGQGSAGTSGGGTAAGTGEKTYDAEITLGSRPTVKGSNATADGTVVKITSGGSYRVSGSTSDGQIMVSTATEEKVKLVLDGVDITCSSGPAIFINEAKKCTVELADGSTNRLRDTSKDKVNDGVIFSNDTLRIKGGGALEITAGNAHGIASDDDVIIEGGTYNITSVKSGIFAHDDITVSGGTITVFGGTNGIKSRGTININGGTMYISGGTKEEKSSIYAGSALNYTGGYVYAAGNKVTMPSTAATPYVGFAFPQGGSAGSQLTFYINSSEKATITSKNNFVSAVMFSPDLAVGNSVSISVNGANSGDFTVSETKNEYTVK